MNQVKTLGLLFALSGLLTAIGYFVIGGSTGIIIGVALAAISNLGAWYYSDQIALGSFNAQPVGPEDAPDLYAMLKTLSDRANIPTPQLCIIQSPAANAFATGRDPEHATVAVTEGIVNVLSREELEGVLAHELSHVINRDTLTQAIAATIGGAISSLAYMAQWASYGMAYESDDDRRGPNPIGLMLAVFLAPVAASVIQMTISRTREFAADANAGRLTGNPEALANALQKLEAGAQKMAIQGNPAFEPLLIINSFSGKGLANLFSTHPSTEDRIKKLLELQQALVLERANTNVQLQP
jgi:heat shock protein HtpX